MNSKNFTSESEWIETALDYIRSINPKTVALCGGQTVKPLYQALSQTPLAKQAHFFQTDERFVPATHPDSNQKMIREILKPAHFTPFNTDLQIETSIEDYTAKIPTQFDLIILSLGPDGHIASIFPDTPESTEPVTYTIAPKEFAIKDRLTLTIPTILKAKHILLLAKNRDTTIKRLEEENLPASKIKQKAQTINLTP